MKYCAEFAITPSPPLPILCAWLENHLKFPASWITLPFAAHIASKGPVLRETGR